MISRCCLAVASVILLFPQVAAAQTPVETALRDMVAALDATPEWAASFRDLSYDPATDTATLSGFVARTERPGTEISVDTVAVTGYVASPDGSFTAKAVRADGGTLTAGFITLAIGDLGLEELSVPVMEGLVFESDKPFTSIAKAYGEAIKARFAHARIGSLEVIETINGAKNRISYNQMRFDGFADGKLAFMSAGQIQFETPSPQGLVAMTIGSFESHDTDLGAFVRVYDPDAYQGGVGDMVWHNGVASAAYHNILMDVPGARIAIDGITAEDLRVRQPPTSFTEFLDAIMVNPDMPKSRMERLSRDNAPGLLGAFALGRLAVTGLSVKANGIDHLTLGAIKISDFSIDGLGEFAIEGLEGAVRGQGAMRIGRFAFGGMKFGGIDGFNRLLAATESGQHFDPKMVMPTLGFLELAGLEVQTPDIDRLSLSRLRIDASNYVDAVPTVSSVELSSLMLPASAIKDRKTRELLQRFGYDNLDLSAAIDSEWHAAGDTYTVNKFELNLKKIGSLAAKFTVTGFPLTGFQDATALQAALPNLALSSAELTFKDETIVGTGLVLLGEQFHFNVPLDQFRQQFAGAIPLLLSWGAASNPQLAALVRELGLLPQITPAVSQLVAAPGGSITFTLSPSSPVPLMSIPNVAQTAPEKLAGLLGLTVTGEPGAAPPPAAPAPAPATPAPAPQSNGGGTGTGGATDGGHPAQEQSN